MTTLEQPTSAQIAMQLDSTTEWEAGIAKAIVEQSGGIAAFTIIVDVVPLGIPLTSISGFKETDDTLGFFLDHREALMGIIKEISSDRQMVPERYLMTLDEGLDLATAKEIFLVLSTPELLDNSKSRVAAAYYSLIHKIVLQVIINVIGDIHVRRSGIPF